MKNVWWSDQGMYTHLLTALWYFNIRLCCVSINCNRNINYTLEVFNLMFEPNSTTTDTIKRRSQLWSENVVFTSSKILVWHTLLGQMCMLCTVLRLLDDFYMPSRVFWYFWTNKLSDQNGLHKWYCRAAEIKKNAPGLPGYKTWKCC